jgi:TIR domain
MSAGSPSVFISYSRKDVALARKLQSRLGKLGVRAWLDVKQVHEGKSVLREIENALRTASCYVVLMSDEALTSPKVNFEIGAAIGQEKRLIPVFLSKHASRNTLARLKRARGISAEGLSPNDIADRVAEVIQKAAA